LVIGSIADGFADIEAKVHAIFQGIVAAGSPREAAPRRYRQLIY